MKLIKRRALAEVVNCNKIIEKNIVFAAREEECNGHEAAKDSTCSSQETDYAAPLLEDETCPFWAGRVYFSKKSANRSVTSPNLCCMQS